MKRGLLLIPLLSTALLAVPKISSVKLFADEGGKPGKEVSYFLPSWHKIHFKVGFDQLKVGQTKVRWVFTGMDTSAGKNVKVTELTTSGLVANQSEAAVSLPRDWPFGKYQADVYVDGTKVKSIPYFVSPPPEALKSLGSTLYRDSGGKPGAAVKSFSPKDHMLHFSVEVNGFLMGKCRVHWDYVAVDTTAGKNQKVTSADTDFQDFPGNTLTGKVSLPRDWPTGSYRADVSINGKMLAQIPYTVK